MSPIRWAVGLTCTFHGFTYKLNNNKYSTSKPQMSRSECQYNMKGNWECSVITCELFGLFVSSMYII